MMRMTSCSPWFRKFQDVTGTERHASVTTVRYRRPGLPRRAARVQLGERRRCAGLRKAGVRPERCCTEFQNDALRVDTGRRSNGRVAAQGWCADRAAQAAVLRMNPRTALCPLRFNVLPDGCVLCMQLRTGDRCRDRHQHLQGRNAQRRDARTIRHGGYSTSERCEKSNRRRVRGASGQFPPAGVSGIQRPVTISNAPTELEQWHRLRG